MMSDNQKAVLDRIQANNGFIQFISFCKPFSAFKFAEEKFGDSRSIHRCLSLARSKGCKTIIVEKIRPLGLLQDENSSLLSMGFWSCADIYRVSFFTAKIRGKIGVVTCRSRHLQGYAIIKCDGKDKKDCRWYVYESVFKKYDHRHNCVSSPAQYEVRVGWRKFKISGVLYCQQNGLNKSCAHVALRSILSRLGKDVSYSEMNAIASTLCDEGKYKPCDGLDSSQIAKIFESHNVNVRALDYEELRKVSGNDNARKDFPYQKILYQGVESGEGVLLGFKLDNPKYDDARHMIPFYGHTFNKDTWITEAEAEYFKISENIGYIPSDKWTSSFIGHDDNFGSNFCVPRLYLDSAKVDYVAEILPENVKYTGVEAEAAAFPLLKWFIPYLEKDNLWHKRLRVAFESSFPSVVLRALCVKPQKYFKHLQDSTDWEGNRDSLRIINKVRSFNWPEKFWVVEISLPNLFSANERKLGEIVLDATVSLDSSGKIAATSVFLFSRLPSVYIIAGETKSVNNLPLWDRVESAITTHLPLLSLSEE